MLLGFGSAFAQTDESVFVIQDFELAKGMGSDASFIQANMPILRQIASRLKENRLLFAECTAWADATRFSLFHDQKNAATTLSRYNLIVGILEDSLGVDSRQILPVKTREAGAKGGQHRKVEIRLTENPLYVTQGQLDSLRNEIRSALASFARPVAAFEQRTEFFSLAEIGIGVSSHVYGHVIPIVTGRIGNHTVSFEAQFGNSVFTGSKRYALQTLDVRYTLVAGYVRYHPGWNQTIDLIAGWEELQERSTAYGRYVNKSAGPSLGASYDFARFLRCTVLWTPAEEDRFGSGQVTWHADRFRIAFTIFKQWEK
jgi:hypothetical protein